jgi:thiol-disulfide isomerase/thioredoxin
MKSFLLSLLTCLILFQGFSQEKSITVLNDSTELQTEEGQTIKLTYMLNGKSISIKDKDKIMANETYVQQEFNVKQVGKEFIGETNFVMDDVPQYLKKEVKPIVLKPVTLDMQKNLKGVYFPDFSWTNITGNKYSIGSLTGKTVVLNFWHTSCVPCIAEMPLLNELVGKYANRNVVFVASTPNSKEQLMKFLTKTTFNYKQVPEVDPKLIFDPFPGWPIHIVVNGEGIIKFSALGKQKDIEQKLMKSIDESLAENK